LQAFPLRWINVARAQSVHMKSMDRFDKPALPLTAPEAQPATDCRMAAATGQQKLATVVAAWPAGVSPLAQAVNACQRRGPREADWLTRAPNSIVLPPVF